MEYIELDGGACDDCTIALANDDFTGMSEATANTVRAGIARFGEHARHLVIGESLGFSWRPCAVCGGLAGDRHVVGYLQEVAQPELEDDEDGRWVPTPRGND